MAQKNRKNSITDSLKKKGKELNIDDMQKQVEQLHETQPPKKKKSVRISVDVPEDIYLKMKADTVQQRKTIREYVLQLVKRDLGIE